MVLVVHGDPKDPAHLRAQMPIEEAVRTPATQSFERLAEFDRQQVLAQTQQATMQQDVQQQDAQRQSTAAIRI